MSEKERVHFKIAIPIDLKQTLEHHAVENRRSLSAEIISRLEASLVKGDGLDTTTGSDTETEVMTPALFDLLFGQIKELRDDVQAIKDKSDK